VRRRDVARARGWRGGVVSAARIRWGSLCGAACHRHCRGSGEVQLFGGRGPSGPTSPIVCRAAISAMRLMDYTDCVGVRRHLRRGVVGDVFHFSVAPVVWPSEGPPLVVGCVSAQCSIAQLPTNHGAPQTIRSSACTGRAITRRPQDEVRVRARLYERVWLGQWYAAQGKIRAGDRPARDRHGRRWGVPQRARRAGRRDSPWARIVDCEAAAASARGY